MYAFQKIGDYLIGERTASFVYVIKVNGDYKVGKASDMKARLVMYKSSYSPHSQPNIEIIFLQKFDNNLINRDAEKALLEYDCDGDMFHDNSEWIKPYFTDKHIRNYARAAMDNFLNNWKKEFRNGNYPYRWGTNKCPKVNFLNSITTERMI
jgi:hypothetical protein